MSTKDLKNTIEAVANLLEGEGAENVAPDYKARHVKVRFTVNGVNGMVVLPKSTRNHRNKNNCLSRARRAVREAREYRSPS